MTGSSHKTPRPRKRPRGFQGHVSEIDLRLLRVFHTVAEQGASVRPKLRWAKANRLSVWIFPRWKPVWA